MTTTPSIARKAVHLELDATDVVSDAFRVRFRERLTIQVDGSHSTGAVKLQWRIAGGEWQDAKDENDQDIVITGPKVERDISVTGVDEVRLIVSAEESGKLARVIFQAWGDER